MRPPIMVQSSGVSIGQAAGPAFVIGTPKMMAAPGLPTMIRPPIMMRVPGAIPAGPATVISSPGLTRLTSASKMKPMFIAAGPPSIIKNPMRTKLLMERPVPRIQSNQKMNTLLADFWGDEIDVTKDGRVIDRSDSEATVARDGRQRADARRRSPKQTGIVVGIDFGNTFTGVSYAHQGDGEMIDFVKWYAAFKRSRNDSILVTDYKLQLFDKGARGKLEHGLHLTDVFTQYLRSLHQHLVDEINKSQAVTSSSVPIHYCITVPQSWTLPTRELVLRCYVEAGIILQTPAPNMTVITEAEAAATYCREHCDEFESLKDGDIFMVCDAGGLTTHATVFRVDDALGVRQFVRVSSSHAENCGSVVLDRKFKELVLEKLTGIDMDAKPQRQRALELLLEGFEEIKAQFDANSREEIKHIAIPSGLDVQELGETPEWLEDGFMALTGEELCEHVFDPVANMIKALINEQCEDLSVCAGLFLVGGYGSNKHLLHCLKMLSGESSEPSKTPRSSSLSTSTRASNKSAGTTPTIRKVVMVQRAELAVARGAVIYGLKSAARHAKVFL
ncbi:hypothetical protein BGW38_006762 [Lunasporangiospora selenospora]|uniref:Hsp70 protein n=1 Tax=Lunasporangiospora selenospora TaxID=979761 RepID=A0A9P6KAJ4_9FUNG|nr:hypothetical protein BGW38_006762 [Lunasporangiospora selenospora]